MKFILPIFVCFVVAKAAVLTVSKEGSLRDKVYTAPPVNVTLYFESLCPGCRIFITSQVNDTWHKIGSSGIMNFDFIPYGNAQQVTKKGKKVIECQHGEKECDGNKVEACAMHYHPKVNDHMEFILCFEQAFIFSENWNKTLQSCGPKHNVSVPEVAACTAGALGESLLEEMGKRTGDHEYVPWVIVNGAHDEAAQKHLLDAVCKTYTGTLPPGCPE